MEKEKPQILIVHGYKIYQSGKFEILTEVTCRKVVKIQNQYDYIVCINGWHDPRAYDPNDGRPTTGELMKERLIELGVPRNKLFTQFDLPDCDKFVPTRDTIEEYDFIPHVLQGLDKLKKLNLPKAQKIPFAQCAILWFRPRLRKLKRSRNSNCIKIETAFSYKLLLSLTFVKRIISEIVANLLMLFDPADKLGILKKRREARTPIEKLNQIYPHRVLPTSWNE